MSSLLANALNKLARSVGLVPADTESQDVAFPQRTPEDVKRALAAARRIRAQAKEMKLGITREEILDLVKQGRR